MKFTSEDDILNEEFRKLVIEEVIDGPENLERKAQELRKHEIYRDMNSKWVMVGIEKEGFKKVTVERMRNRATNISICRKIVNKLAQTYIGGVDRTVEDDDTAQKSVESLADVLNFDTQMKKSDRYRQLFKNALPWCVPIKNTKESRNARRDVYDLNLKVFAPWEYDVVQDPNDPTKAAVVLFTDFPERAQLATNDDGKGAQGYRTTTTSAAAGDGVDQIIADSPEDKGQKRDERRVIWWSDTYHFTTDINGKIVDAPDNNLNPIKTLPGSVITSDQDGNFWARGGEDVVEGSILINKILTDVNFITFVQGWGQLVIAAENVPKVLVGGPDNAFIFEVTPDGVTPQVFYATSNPPIDSWHETVRLILAALLTTNGLSVRNIAAKLDSSDVVSGVAMLIENSDVVTEIKDVQKLYQDKEPEIWEVIRLWHELYSKTQQLCPDLLEIATFQTAKVKLKFHDIKPPMSEKEHLEQLQMRKDLGLNTMVELLKKDNPDLTEEEAQKRATELMDEQKKAQEVQAQIFSKLQTTGVKPGKEVPNGKSQIDQAKQKDQAQKG